MESCLVNLEECKSEIIDELITISEVKLIHLAQILELFYELNKLAHQVVVNIENRNGVDLSEEGCLLKYEIYQYAKFSRATFLTHIHYLETELNSFQRCPIPTNISLNFQEISDTNLVATIDYSLNPFGFDHNPAWIFEINGRLSTHNFRGRVLHSAIDYLTHKLYFYCITTQRGIHEFDLSKHSLTDIIPFSYEPYGICVDSLYVYVLAFEGRPFSNGIMKIDKNTKQIIKKWSERTKPEFIGFETDGVDSLYTLRGNSLCIFSKITLSQLRELRLTNKLKHTDKVKGFSIFQNFLYIMPHDVLFDILVYSLISGDLLRTISLQLDQVCTQISLSSIGNILCVNSSNKEFFNLFSTKGELIHAFTLPDKSAEVVGLNFIVPYIIVLCLLPNESLKILAY